MMKRYNFVTRGAGCRTLRRPQTGKGLSLIHILVLLQDSKGNGLAGGIGGGDMMMMDGRSRTPSSLMVKYTKVAAVVLFVLTIGVNVISALVK